MLLQLDGITAVLLCGDLNVHDGTTMVERSQTMTDSRHCHAAFTSAAPHFCWEMTIIYYLVPKYYC